MKAHVNPAQNTTGAQAVCNNKECAKRFDVKSNFKEENLGTVSHFGEVTRKYLCCPECGSEYNVGFINGAVEELLEENRAMVIDGSKDHRAKLRRNKAKGVKLMNRIETAWRKQEKEDL